MFSGRARAARAALINGTPGRLVAARPTARRVRVHHRQRNLMTAIDLIAIRTACMNYSRDAE